MLINHETLYVYLHLPDEAIGKGALHTWAQGEALLRPLPYICNQHSIMSVTIFCNRFNIQKIKVLFNVSFKIKIIIIIFYTSIRNYIIILCTISAIPGNVILLFLIDDFQSISIFKKLENPLKN